MSRILLVDDDDSFRSMLGMTLRKLGHAVREAHNGDEGLRLAAAEPPDLVFMDMIMPEKEGLETITALRRRQPEVKVIAMSGGSRDGRVDYLKVAKRMGANHTLTKPFSPEALEKALELLKG
jgi:CheY-like chemotaxis protein